jgi:Na+/glutamate symporter
MAIKQLAVLGALLSIANPGYAFDDSFDGINRAQAVMFYYAIPIDAQSRKERKPWMGMLVQGQQDYRGAGVGGFGLDTRLFNVLEESGASAASLVLIGVAAVGTAAVVMHKGKSSQQQVQSQPQQAAPPSQVPCSTCPAH